MVVADAWYASGTFWAAAGVVVAVMAGVAVVWVTWRVGNPRRRLIYGMPQSTPLISAGREVRGLEVRRNGVHFKDPYVVTVMLVNRGRLDIGTGDFDDRRALRLDVGAPIVEILEVTSSPKGLKAPEVRADGTGVLVGPDKVGAGQGVIVVLLVDGTKPALSCPDNPLLNVEVRDQPPEDAGRMFPGVLRPLASLTALVVVEVVGISMLMLHVRGTVALVGTVAASLAALPWLAAVLDSLDRRSLRSSR